MSSFDVLFDPATSHWLMKRAELSVHGGHNTAEMGLSYLRWYDPPGGKVEYPDKPGGYLRVWAAESKHAGYYSLDQCNGGGFAGSDTCERNTIMIREIAPPQYNIGHRNVPFIDSVTVRSSLHPDYGSGRIETYWTESDFRGWYSIGAGGSSADPYSVFLAELGF